MSFYVVVGAKASIQSPACDYTENLLRDNSIHVYYFEYITITNSWPPNKVSFKQIPITCNMATPRPGTDHRSVGPVSIALGPEELRWLDLPW